MPLQSSRPVAVPHTDPVEPGTRCECTTPCPDPVQCERERRGSETGWWAFAERQPRWRLANGQEI
jgi:hypothetical protein